MNVDGFWSIIERSRNAASPDEREIVLGKQLRALAPAECLAFAKHFDEAFARAYTWPLWGAAYLINGGCSDDGFADFRSSLIMRGRAIFDGAIENPDSLALIDLPEEEWMHEGYAYVVTDAVDATGIPDANDQRPEHPSDPTGINWESEDALAQLLPALHRKHVG